MRRAIRATWTFGSAIPAGKFRIELSTAVTDVAGNALDGEWSNLTNSTPDNFTDDPVTGDNVFPSGNGTSGAPNNRFEFFFSLLPGDSNQDGVVTSADTSAVADINGDGEADSADESLINTTYLGTTLPVRVQHGDYLDDEKNDINDYNVWKMTFGSTTDLRADGSGNGIVDAADYSPWRDNSGATSAWYRGVAGSGSGASLPVVLFGEAPRVANVTVSGSNSTHAAYSFDSVDGSGEQLRTVPIGRPDTISITFTEDVNIQADNLRVVGMQTFMQPTLEEFTYDIGSMTATWRFVGFNYPDLYYTQGDQFLISLDHAVTDVEGNSLDGEWTNPMSLFTTNSAVSEFPSGDGTAGGDFNFVLTLLPGDANRDLIVDSADSAIVQANLYTGSNKLFTQGEFSGDGQVTTADINMLSSNWELNLQTLDLLADLNGDWKVDQADVDIIYDNWDSGLQNPTEDDGDLNGDSDIDVDDLDLAYAQYGLEVAFVT